MISTDLLQQYILLQPDCKEALDRSATISSQLLPYQAAAFYRRPGEYIHGL